MIDAPSDPVKFELTLSWHVFIASTTCTFKLKSYFSVECILIFECGLFECFGSLSIYMNCRIKNSGPLFKYSHTKWHFMLIICT